MLEKKIGKNALVTSLIVGVGLTGCGTTITYLDKQTKVWYDCSTIRDYPKEHPCSEVIKEYLAAQPKYSSSSLSERDRDKGFSAADKDKGGHYECDRGKGR